MVKKIKEIIDGLGTKKLAMIILGVVGILIIVSTGFNAINTTPETTGKVVGDLNITDVILEASANGDPSDPYYYYDVSARIKNLAVMGNSEYSYIEDGSYYAEVKFYDSDGNLLKTDGSISIYRENDKKSRFSSYISLEKKVTMGKVEIRVFNKDGDELALTTYQFDNIVFDDNTEIKDKSDSSSSNSSSSSDDSASSSSSGTFNEGFADGVNDAHDGKSPLYTYSTVSSWDSNEYQQGYADGYESYGSNPHLYSDLIR